MSHEAEFVFDAQVNDERGVGRGSRGAAYNEEAKVSDKRRTHTDECDAARQSDGDWFSRRVGCDGQLCECHCSLCGPLFPEESRCADCDCPCEGCYCAGTCADGHPVIHRDPDPGLSLAWRTLAEDTEKERYEFVDASGHAQDCTTARWLTVDQMVMRRLARDDEEPGYGVGTASEFRCGRPGSRDLELPCGIPAVNSVTEKPETGPSCAEVADAAKRAGFRVEPLPNGSPGEQTHYGLLGVTRDEYSRLDLWLKPSCARCECYCPKCSDCSKCSCECTGCMCSAKCLTRECIIVEEVSGNGPRPVSEIERRLGTKGSKLLGTRYTRMPGDLHVSNALVRLEQDVQDTHRTVDESSPIDPPTFELSRLDPWWHLDECEHPRLKLTADELVYSTLRLLTDEVARSYERYGVVLEHTDCVKWREQNRGLLVTEPTCEQLAVAAKKLGYEARPVARVRRPNPSSDDYGKKYIRDHVSNEHAIHYEFPNAAHDDRLLLTLYGPPAPSWDEARCDGKCECGCTDCECTRSGRGRCDCECSGCYCRKTCVPVRSEE